MTMTWRDGRDAFHAATLRRPQISNFCVWYVGAPSPRTTWCPASSSLHTGDEWGLRTWCKTSSNGDGRRRCAIGPRSEVEVMGLHPHGRICKSGTR